MGLIDLLMSISTELLAAFVIFLLGLIGSKIPYSFKKYKLRRFFGNDIVTDECKIVYGMLSKTSGDNQVRQKDRPVLERVNYGGRIIKINALRKVITEETIRAHSYIIQELSQYRNGPIVICTDDDAFTDLNYTFMILGGPITNKISELVLSAKENRFLRFYVAEIHQDSRLTIDLISISDIERKVSYKVKQGIDYGIILKIRNSRFPKRYFFVCAGIGGWGTSGAAWYLSKQWKKLYYEFKAREFGIVIEVNQGGDTSAIRVFP